MCIDGNLQATESIINKINDEKDTEAYLHITLSFGERDIEHDRILKAYNEYKSNIMSAYHKDEYNIYAEIHYPKIKSYQDKKTGDLIERFPHVHIVIPKVNLVTNKSLAPFGVYKDNIDYHDAIQERINRQGQLESPYDNQRKYRLFSNSSEFISRYKGDTFKGANAEFRQMVFEMINKKDIRTLSQFKNELSKLGEVSSGRAGSDSEYLKIKLPGQSKNIRLKDACFKLDYIERRELLRIKPTDTQIDNLVNEWRNTRSYEMKHVHPASPKFRKYYYSLEPQERQELLNERRKQFDTTYFQSRRRTTNRESGFERVGFKQFAKISNGLPSLPQRGLVRANRERSEVSQSILPSDANTDLDARRTSRDHQLRRTADRGGRSRDARSTNGGVRAGINTSRLGKGSTTGLPSRLLTVSPVKAAVVDKPKSVAEQLLKTHLSHRTSQQERDQFRVIRQRLEPERLIEHFKKSHGLVPQNYEVFRAKDGSARIKTESRAYNVSDFCTGHMHLNWDQTKTLLSSMYRDQCLEREDRQVLNAISSASRYVTQGYSNKQKLSRLDESIRVFRFLVRQEQFEEKRMALSDLKKYSTLPGREQNSISNAELELRSIKDNFKRQQALAEQLTLKLADLVPTKDLKGKQITFKDVNTGDAIFRDTGNQIVMSSRKPDVAHIAAAMTLAAEKFGTVNITGTKAFQQQVIDVAVAKNLNIVFASKEMQALFVKCRDEFKADHLHVNSDNVTDINAKSQSNSVEHSMDEVSKVSQQIKEALQVVDVLARDQKKMEQLDSHGLAEMAVRHQGLAEKHTDSAGYKYIIAQLEQGAESNKDYGDALAPVIQKEQNQSQPVADDHEYVESKDLDEKAVENEAVILVAHGKAPYLHEEGAKPSYYVELSNGETKWGVGLQDAIKESGVEIGDSVDVQRVGERDVTVMADVKDEDGKKIGIEPLETHRVEWDITLVQRGRDKVELVNDAITVEYHYSKEEGKLQPRFNGQAAKEIPMEVLMAIRESDKFLSQYEVKDILNDALDQKQAQGQLPVNKIYSQQGEVIDLTEQEASTNTLK
ncbi:LPD7 domain-containing protein [Vibrio sinensis]|uniref:LPD7 domain-containing protein n=1 Tax=Vibrio sinensis TaxID=2302434 RepID=UPI001FB3917A|nr:LPD7 domain-containing protein [Vibrio sinensis]